MSGWPLKDQVRVAGVDDGRYIRGSDRTPIVITIMRLDGYVEGVLISDVGTDGSDSSECVYDMLKASGHLPQIRAILSDGACLAGFNVLDMLDLHERTGVPIITCSDKEPKTHSIAEALKGTFQDWEERLSMITRYEPKEVDLKDGPCFIRCEGITQEKAEWLVRKATVRGRTPEPIRISHMIAHSLDRSSEVN